MLKYVSGTRKTSHKVAINSKPYALLSIWIKFSDKTICVKVSLELPGSVGSDRVGSVAVSNQLSSVAARCY